MECDQSLVKLKRPVFERQGVLTREFPAREFTGWIKRM